MMYSLIYPLQTNGTFHAPVTTGGIHGRNRKRYYQLAFNLKIAGRAPVSTQFLFTRSLRSGHVVFMGKQVHKYAIQNGASISNDENHLVSTKNLSFFSEVYDRKVQKHLEDCRQKDVESKGYNFLPKVMFMTFTWHTIKPHAEKQFYKPYALEASEKVRNRTSCRFNLKVMTTVLQT